MLAFKNYRLRHFNFKMVLYILILSVIGILVITSATMNSDGDTTSKQMMGVCVGVICMVILSLVDYHWILKYYALIYIAMVGVLVAVLIVGKDSGTNATRWIDLPAIGRIQPSEFAKIGSILFFAKFFESNEEKINSPVTVFGSLALFAIPLYAIFAQPDLSTSIVFGVLFLVMIYAAKISYKWVFGTIAVVIPAVSVFLYLLLNGHYLFLREYQANRILSFFGLVENTQDLLLQQINSRMAIGSGQLYGKGLFNTTLESVKNGNFLMEEDTDFIFAIVGEEMGFVGSCTVIGLLTLVILECIWLGARAKDLSGRLICTGMAALIAFQGFINIGVASFLLPNTGLPLPFISAGLSSLLSVFLGMGVVLNVGMQRKVEVL